MKSIRKYLTDAALALALVIAPAPVLHAETPSDMLVIASRIDDITSLDPAEGFEIAGSDVNRNIYMKLVNLDPMDLERGYQPEIAESWQVSADGKSITFKIRDGLKFHSGNPVRAEDVEFSLRRAVLLNRTPAFILTQFGLSADNLAQTLRVDGDTVTLTTDKPYAISFVLNCLTSIIGGVVDEKEVMAHEVNGDLGNEWLKTNSAGSGAYKLVSWKPSTSVTLQANPDYYRGAPAMKRVIVRHVSESASQRLQLERGDIDIARNLNPEDIQGIHGQDGIVVAEELRGQIMYASLNQNHPILSKPEVRQAFKYLVDYEGMQNSFLNGQWKIHQNFLPKPYLGASSDNPFKLDIDKAKELLARAGVADGFEIEVGVREAQERVEIAQSLQNTLAQAGIKLKITVATSKLMIGRYRARELEMYIGAWGSDYPDPQTNAGTFAYNPDNSEQAQATGLLTWRNAWSSEELNQLVLTALVENDSAKRAQTYTEMQARFREISPFIMMFQKNEQVGLRSNVKHFSMGHAVTAASYWQVVKD